MPMASPSDLLNTSEKSQAVPSYLVPFKPRACFPIFENHHVIIVGPSERPKNSVNGYMYMLTERNGVFTACAHA